MPYLANRRLERLLSVTGMILIIARNILRLDVLSDSLNTFVRCGMDSGGWRARDQLWRMACFGTRR